MERGHLIVIEIYPGLFICTPSQFRGVTRFKAVSGRYIVERGVSHGMFCLCFWSTRRYAHSPFFACVLS